MLPSRDNLASPLRHVPHLEEAVVLLTVQSRAVAICFVDPVFIAAIATAHFSGGYIIVFHDLS